MTTMSQPTRWGWLALAGGPLLGAGAGRLVGSTATWLVVGAVIGLAVAVMIVVLEMRILVALPVGAGTGVGAYLGATVVGAVCQPAGCPAFETAAAVTTGIGALVGVGLVVALVARSFDEYRDSQRRGAPPATSSCNADDGPSD